MKNPDIIDAVRPIIIAFEKLGILYYINEEISYLKNLIGFELVE